MQGMCWTFIVHQRSLVQRATVATNLLFLAVVTCMVAENAIMIFVMLALI